MKTIKNKKQQQCTCLFLFLTVLILLWSASSGFCAEVLFRFVSKSGDSMHLHCVADVILYNYLEILC